MANPVTAWLQLRDSALFQRLLRGFGWSVAGIVLGRMATLLASIIVARELGREVYGEFALLQSTTLMLGELGGLGVGVAAATLLGQYRHSDSDRASGIATLNLVAPAVLAGFIALLLWIEREPVAWSLFENPKLAPLIAFIALSFFFASINGAIAGLLTGLERFRSSAYRILLISLLTAGGQILMVRSHGIEGVLIAVMLANAVCAVWGLVIIIRALHEAGLAFDLGHAVKEIRMLWTINVPAMTSSLLVLPVTWGAGVILVRQPGGYAEMAVFNIANQWKMAMLIAPTVLGTVLLPTLARLAGNDNRGKYHQAIKLQLLANALAASVFVTAMCLIAPYLLGFYGEGYKQDAEVMWLMFLVAGLMTFNTVVGNALTSEGRLWLGLWMNGAWALVLMISAWMLCPRLGAVGLGWAYLLAYAAHTLWQALALRWLVFRERSF